MIRRELSLSVVLGIESVWQVDATVIFKEKIVRPLQIAILISIVTYQIIHASTQSKQGINANRRISATCLLAANMTQISQYLADAKNISLLPPELVNEYLLTFQLAVYAQYVEDLLVCSDGFGALDSMLYPDFILLKSL